MGNWDDLIASANACAVSLMDLCTETVKLAQALNEWLTFTVHTDMTDKDRKRLFYGFEDNNWLKLHGKPMRRWKYLGGN